MDFDIAVIGSGPGGYVAAIRAAQLGKSVAIIEQAEIGGICLNWGCIPTKALLRSAHIYHEMQSAGAYGIQITGSVTPDFKAIMARSREVSATMSKGVQYLLNKHKITIITGHGAIRSPHDVIVRFENGETQTITATHIIIATGARPKALPGIPIDGEKVISYRQALALEKQPESMIVIGSGAIGVELANFYHTLGTRVTVIEYLPNLVPTEDEEISKYLERCFRKARLPFMTGTAVKSVDVSEEKCRVTVETAKGEQTLEAEIVLSAAGVIANLENIGLETVGIETQKGKIVTDEYYRTNVAGIYAIGDVIATPALAHVASAEAICCVEAIAGLAPAPINYAHIPSCIYTSPEIASVGMTEKEAVSKGYEIRIGKFPYTASGKATAMGNKDGFIKLIFNKEDDSLLGAHFIGTNVTEMIMEAGISLKMKAKSMDIIHTIHPHPTLSEAVMEAAAAAYGESVHIQ